MDQAEHEKRTEVETIWQCLGRVYKEGSLLSYLDVVIVYCVSEKNSCLEN